MASDPDVLQLVAILDAEGFGDVAGQLLAEVNLGREVEVLRSSSGSGDSEAPDDYEPETDVRREPVAEADQFEFAMSFLRERLTTPVRQLAEAERIAGEIGRRKPVRILFVPPEMLEDSVVALVAAPGDEGLADKFDDLLRRLPALRVPPESSAT